MKKFAVVQIRGEFKFYTNDVENYFLSGDISTAYEEANRLCRLTNKKYAVLELVGVCELDIQEPHVKWNTNVS